MKGEREKGQAPFLSNLHFCTSTPFPHPTCSAPTVPRHSLELASQLFLSGAGAGYHLETYVHCHS